MANIKSLERAGAIIHMVSTIVLTIWLVVLVASFFYSSPAGALVYLFLAAAVLVGLDFAVGRKIKSERVKLGLANTVGPSNFGRGDGMPHLYDSVPILPKVQDQSQVIEKQTGSA